VEERKKKRKGKLTFARFVELADADELIIVRKFNLRV
jgi:hypothetical protein